MYSLGRYPIILWYNRFVNIEKVTITGAKGVIGSVLIQALSKEYQVAGVDLPGVDLRSFSVVDKVLADQDAVIHLAWNKRKIVDGVSKPIDDSDTREIDPGNILMARHVYEAARKHGLKKIIMASSVEADDYPAWSSKDGLMDPYALPTPTTPYGASKVWIEAEGRDIARHFGIEVTCIRFGAVKRDNTLDKGVEYLFLNHEDCISAVRAVLATDSVPRNYAIFYAVSNNPSIRHDLINPFNWKPGK